MPLWMSFCISVACIAGGGLLANFIGELLPRAWFRADRFPFRTRKWERDGKLYEKVGVHRWKDRVPDMSRIRKKKMVPKHLGKCPTAEGVHTLALETCRAEAVHSVLCVLSVGLIFLWENRWLGVGVMAVYILCNFPFIIIQRYNRPALLALEERLLRREARKASLRQAREENLTDESSDSVCRRG